MVSGINLWFWVPILVSILVSLVFILASKKYKTDKEYPKTVQAGNLKGIVPNTAFGLGIAGILGGGYFRFINEGIRENLPVKSFLSAIVLLSIMATILSFQHQITMNNCARKIGGEDCFDLQSGWPYAVLGTIYVLTISVIILVGIIILMAINA